MRIHGSTLTRLRYRAGLSQTELAERTGLNPGQISRLESGERRGNPHTIKVLAAYFDVTVDELCAATDDDQVA